MKTLVANGGRDTITGGVGGHSSGDVIGPIGTGERFAVALADIAEDAEGVVVTGGVHELPAAAADVWDHGDKVYWDVADGNLTDDADTGTNKLIGTAVGDKAADATSAKVLLNNTPLPPSAA
jgi:predicted RecA/RadA family phage recombinase